MWFLEYFVLELLFFEGFLRFFNIVCFILFFILFFQKGKKKNLVNLNLFFFLYQEQNFLDYEFFKGKDMFYLFILSSQYIVGK